MTRGNTRDLSGPGSDSRAILCGIERTLFLGTCHLLLIFFKFSTPSAHLFDSGSTVAGCYESPWILCIPAITPSVNWWSRQKAGREAACDSVTDQ